MNIYVKYSIEFFLKMFVYEQLPQTGMFTVFSSYSTYEIMDQQMFCIQFSCTGFWEESTWLPFLEFVNNLFEGAKYGVYAVYCLEYFVGKYSQTSH